MLCNLNDVLDEAMRNKYAVGLFNTTDTDLLQAVIEAAEELRAPVILGTAEVLLPYGELKLMAPAMLAAAQRAKVPVVVHYDHGLTFERCMEALKLGFTSVMFDGSALDREENILQTRQMVKVAHAFGASVEGEIGHVGNASDTPDTAYTTPDEAADFLKNTQVDALAVAIGTAHGAYKTRPQLSFDSLKAIREAIAVPLVLHGGSGLSDDDFRTSIRYGISKVNIFTDLLLAGQRELAACIDEGLDYLEGRNRKVEAVKRAVMEKISLFGCAGRY